MSEEAPEQARALPTPVRKIELTSWGSMTPKEDVKLLRTFTTLDLSQKGRESYLDRELIPTYLGAFLGGFPTILRWV